MKLAVRFEYALSNPERIRTWITSGHEITLFSAALASASSENYLPVLRGLQEQLEARGLPLMLILGSINAKDFIIEMPNLLEEGKSCEN